MSIIMSGKTDVNNPLAFSGIYKALKLTADLGITANTSPKSQRLKTIQMAMTWMDTSKVIHSYNRILLSNKRLKKKNPDTCYNVSVSQIQHAH